MSWIFIKIFFLSRTFTVNHAWSLNIPVWPIGVWYCKVLKVWDRQAPLISSDLWNVQLQIERDQSCSAIFRCAFRWFHSGCVSNAKGWKRRRRKLSHLSQRQHSLCRKRPAVVRCKAVSSCLLTKSFSNAGSMIAAHYWNLMLYLQICTQNMSEYECISELEILVSVDITWHEAFLIEFWVSLISQMSVYIWKFGTPKISTRNAVFGTEWIFGRHILRRHTSPFPDLGTISNPCWGNTKAFSSEESTA